MEEWTGEDPRFRALVRATEELTAPGAAFETRREEVLGTPVDVFVNRPHSLPQILEESQVHGDADCYVFDDGSRFSFTGLALATADLAARLSNDFGISQGDRVAICAPNSPEWLVTLWAVTSLGGVVVAMNGWWTAPEMRHAIELTRPSLVVVDDRRAERLGGDVVAPVAVIGERFPAVVPGSTVGHPAAVPRPAIAEDDPAILLFTSGTTGRPKAAALSHRSVIGFVMLQGFLGARSAVMAGATPRAGGGPVRLAPFPLFHVSGLGTAVTTVLGAGTTVWPLGRFDPARVVAVSRREHVQVWGGATTHLVRLLDCPDLDDFPTSQILQVGIGGSATSPELVRRVEERFPHLRDTMSTGYGSTETGGLISWAPNWMLRTTPGCVGPPLPTVQVRVTDEQGSPLDSGDPGNIEARSPITMLRYWDNEDADAETVRPGRWIRTGDFGALRHGVLLLATRKRDLIIRGGENIYPPEVENRIEEHPAVVESAVFGVADPTHGEVVKAVVVVEPGSELTEDAIAAFCAETLASYKVPAVVELRADLLPRNPSGKVMKHVLSGAAESGFIQE